MAYREYDVHIDVTDKKQKKGIMLFKDYFTDYFNDLTNEQIGILITALAEDSYFKKLIYAKEPIEKDRKLKAIFGKLKNYNDQANDSWQRTRDSWQKYDDIKSIQEELCCSYEKAKEEYKKIKKKGGNSNGKQ